MTTTDTASAITVSVSTSSLTSRYTQLGTALATAADQHRVQPLVARVALALHERGGQATGDELEADLDLHEPAVRRVLGFLYAARLAVGDAIDGGPRRAGITTRVRLTDAGEQLARAVIAHHNPRST